MKPHGCIYVLTSPARCLFKAGKTVVAVVKSATRACAPRPGKLLRRHRKKSCPDHAPPKPSDEMSTDQESAGRLSQGRAASGPCHSSAPEEQIYKGTVAHPSDDNGLHDSRHLSVKRDLSSANLSLLLGCKTKLQLTGLSDLGSPIDNHGTKQGGQRRPRAYSSCISEASSSSTPVSGPSTPSIDSSRAGSSRRFSYMISALDSIRPHGATADHALPDLQCNVLASKDSSVQLSPEDSNDSAAPEELLNAGSPQASNDPLDILTPEGSNAQMYPETSNNVTAVEEFLDVVTPRDSDDVRGSSTSIAKGSIVQIDSEASSIMTAPEEFFDVLTPCDSNDVLDASAPQDVTAETCPGESSNVTAPDEFFDALTPQDSNESLHLPTPRNSNVHIYPEGLTNGTAPRGLLDVVTPRDLNGEDSGTSGISQSCAKGVAGIHNPRFSCYINATLQGLLSLPAFTAPLLSGKVEKILDMGLAEDASQGRALTLAVLGVVKEMMTRSAGDGLPPVRLDGLLKAMLRTGPQGLQAYANIYHQQDAVEFTGALLRYLHANGCCFRDGGLLRELTEPTAVSGHMRDVYDFEASQVPSWVAEALRTTTMTTRACSTCAAKGCRFDTSFVLPLAIPQGTPSRHVSLLNCLALALDCSQGEGSTCLECTEWTKDTRNAFSCIGDGLILALKRFERRPSSAGGRPARWVKNCCPVDIPQTLDVAPFCNADAMKQMGVGGTEYRLCGVCHHEGTTEGGHYTATTRAQSDGCWRFYSDSRVLDSPCPAGPSQTAYLLFYRRVQAPGGGDLTHV